ncbi:TolC family outer membrane protein [Lysobacter hankyongensis]|uniref:TolC family outer membrane protein n=1 Tax=Lysobacter hankyongensis TaxID=1176535 RepID=A0ABP9C064_9GAMM
MTRRPLALALALLVLPLGAQAEDLLQSYELARNSDPQLSAAEANRLISREGAVQARSLLLPQVNGTASYTRSDGDDESSAPTVSDGSSDSTTRDIGVRLNQMVYDHSAINRARSQNALAQAGDFQLEAAGDQLITRTSTAYFNVLIAMETLAAAQAQETALKKQFDFADKRLEVGLAPITDVHEARAQYDRARANTIVTANALEDAYRALEEITGRDVRALKALPQDFQPELPSSMDSEGWVQSALDNNPSLKAQEYRVKSAESGIEVARGGHYPTVYFGANLGRTRTDGDSTDNLLNATADFERESASRSLGLTLSIPIFAGGGTQSGVRQAISQRDATSDELEQQKRALVRNTRNAYRTLVAGVSEVEARKAAVFSARSAYEASQVGLEVGTRTVLDVLNNQQTLFNAEQEYAQSRYNFLQNRLLLEQAAGTLDIEDLQDINRLLTVDAAPKSSP